MQRFVLIAFSCLVIILLGPNAWAHSQKEPFGHRHRLFPPLFDVIHHIKDDPLHLHLDIDPLGLKTPVDFEPPPQDISFDHTLQARGENDLPSLLNKEEWRGFWQLSATSNLSHLTLTSEGELVSTPLESATHSGNIASWYFLVRLEHDRAWEKSAYGAEYGRIEPDFPYQTGSEFTSDQEGLKLWGHWRLGITKLLVSLRQFRNNVSQEPNQTRLKTSEGRMMLDIVEPSWPHLNFSYTSSVSESTVTPAGATPIKQSHDTARVTVSYDGDSWTTALTSVYSQTNDQLHPDTQEHTMYYELAVSYAFTRAIRIAPTLSLRDKSTQPSQARLTTPSTSLSLTYHGLFDMVDISAHGSYKSGEDTYGSVNYRQVDTSLSFVWDLTKFLRENATLTLKASYVHYADAITPTSSYEDVSGGIVLKIAPS